MTALAIEALEAGLALRVAAIREEVHPRLLARGEVRARAESLHKAEGVGDPYDVWADLLARRIAVLWVLKSLYVRVLEDRGLIRPPRIATEESRELFRHLAESLGASAYLRWVYRDLAQDPGGLPDLFGPQPAEVTTPGDKVSEDLLTFWRDVDPDSGERRWSFARGFDTRLIGDLYERLDPVVRDKYALCQTPRFVEAFVLDRTLDPALADFGVNDTRILDPACGSGHFLVGAFERLAKAWREKDKKLSGTEIARRCLEQVVGIDLNDYACALSRLRLLLAAFELANVERLEQATSFAPQVFCTDALLQHEREESKETQGELFESGGPSRAAVLGPTETGRRLKEVLAKKFRVVVGNPPYITLRDEAKKAYLKEKVGGKPRYASAYKQFSLVNPFTERAFQLLVEDGFLGLFNGNAFMKRDFGKVLITEILAKEDLTQIINLAGAYFGPGYGTPTVLIFARHRKPQGSMVRAVLAKKGEQDRPQDPEQGACWSTIARHADEIGYEDEYISVAHLPRAIASKHPWSLGGGGATGLKLLLEERASAVLGDQIEALGRTAHTGLDAAYLADARTAKRHGLAIPHIAQLVTGDAVREWSLSTPLTVAFPYDANLQVAQEDRSLPVFRWLWPYRSMMWERREPNGTHREIGFTWHQFSRFHPERYRGQGIALAFVSTHNQFVRDPGDKVFNRSGPVIKLGVDATDEDYLGLLGLLNSSTLGFWMRQVFHCKGAQGAGEGIKSEAWEQFYEYDGTKMKKAPLVATDDERLVMYARELDKLGRQQAESAEHVVSSPDWKTAAELGTRLNTLAAERRGRLAQMVALQEELDWHIYECFGLVPRGKSATADLKDVEPLQLGHRPFEIAMARRQAADQLKTSWFERHGSTPTTEVPASYSAKTRRRLEVRLTILSEQKDIALLEQPEYKRRWQQPDFAKETARALETFLVDKVEEWLRARGTPAPVTVARLARALESDPLVQASAEVLVGRQDFDLVQLLSRLIAQEAVPSNKFHVYSQAGLKKRAAWERTWDLQRAEDRGEEVGKIGVPPKYSTKDFQRATYWRMRGRLDVPKERFLGYLEAPTPQGEARYGWAGWDVRQRAQVFAALDEEQEDREAPLDHRCGVLQGLWAALPDLERDHPAAAGEYRALAQSACNQTACPCPVLDSWLRLQAGALPVPLPSASSEAEDEVEVEEDDA